MSMENIRMVRVGDRVVNITQITFAEYSPAYTPAPIEPAEGTKPNHRPITYARAEPKPSSLIVHFVGGETYQFHGGLADELNGHFDLLV